MRSLRLVASSAVALLVLTTAACSFDAAELVEPDATQIDADVGQLRVLRYREDPSAGDRWVDVVTPDPTVVEAGDSFREVDSRTAEDNGPADRRRLFTGVARGRTLLIELNCIGCDDGRPATSVSDTGLHVWDLAVDQPGTEFTDGTLLPEPGSVTSLDIGQYLVVVRGGDSVGDGDGDVDPEIVGDEPTVLRPVARHRPADGADLFVDVFVAVTEGEAAVSAGEQSWTVQVS